MAPSDFNKNQISSSLKELLACKSKRDGTNFNLNQLAHALSMPYSVLFKLTDTDVNRRITNPKIETLAKIVDFFKTDGFNITIDDLIYGLSSSVIDVQAQDISHEMVTRSLPIKSFSGNDVILGHAKLNLPSQRENLVGLKLEEDLGPIFKKESIFVVDLNGKPTDGNLLAVYMKNEKTVQIRKISFTSKGIKLESLDQSSVVTLKSLTECRIYGVVIQVNAKT